MIPARGLGGSRRDQVPGMSATPQAGDIADMPVQAPWLAEPRALLAAAADQDRVAHALLLQDAPGAGGGLLARWLARRLLCTGSGPRPCGSCGACRAVTGGRHPDFLLLQPPEDSQQIRIEQLRELSTELALASHQGGYKVAIIEPAEAMNRFAANALLKTLEEPPSRTVLMLVTQQPSRLPATVLSRCQRVRIRVPARAEALAWLARTLGTGEWEAVLEVVGNAPLLAATLEPRQVAQLRSEVRAGLVEVMAGRGDAAALAERWARSELPLRLNCFENWLTERIRERLTGGTYSMEMRGGTRPATIDPVSNAGALFELLDRLRAFKAAATTPINRTLGLESLLRSLRA